MANLLKELRKENNARDKLLTRENDLLMTDMVVYLRCSDLCDYDIEVIRRELFGMIYEAQIRGETAGQVIGGDYKGFCEELMRNGRQKDFYERLLEWAYIIVSGVGILFAIEIVFSGFILEHFIHGKFSIPITMGFVIATCLILAGSLMVYWYITKHSFELSGRGLSWYKILFIIGFVLYFTATVVINFLLDNISLFQVNVFIPAAVFTAAYLIVKVLGDRNSNRIAGVHN